MRKFKKKASRKNGAILKQCRLSKPQKIKKAALKEKRKEAGLNATMSNAKKRRQLRKERNKRRRTSHGVVTPEGVERLVYNADDRYHPFAEIKSLSLRNLRQMAAEQYWLGSPLETFPKKDFKIMHTWGRRLDGSSVWIKVHP